MPETNVNNKALPIANIAAFLLMIVVNVLSNALPLNGQTAEQVSASLPSYFTPAGYTFSIWGLIYLSLLGFIVYQALPAQRGAPFMAKIGPLFVASSVANAAWIFAWHYGYYGLSLVLMSALLLSLIAIYARLDIGRPGPSTLSAENVLVRFPFSLYLGWISVATIANYAGVLPVLGWDGFGLEGPVWSATMMLVAVVVATALLYNRRSLPYAGVLIWALFGIRSAFTDVALVANMALIASALIAVAAAVGYVRLGRAGAAA